MKKALLLLMVIAMVAVSASATKIYVCGTKITGTTNFTTSGGSVNYNESTRTLTISNVDYTKTGSSNNGISVDEVSGPLTINLVGNVKFDIGDADAVLCKSGKATYINVSGIAYLYCRSQNHAALKLQDGDVTIQGNGEFYINHVAYGHAVKGGAGSEKLTLQIKTCCIYSYDTRLHNLNKVTINPTGSFGSDDYSTKIVFNTFNANAGYATASSVSSWSAGTNVKILKPLEYYGYNINNLTSTIFSHEVVVTDITPVAVLNSTYFPDANFCSYLLGLYSKGYINTSDVNSRTSMSPSGKNILTLQGIGYFNKLTSLDCSNNGISSLDVSALTQLKTLNASSNQLTSIYLPSSLETLNLSNNKKFTTFSMCYNSALKSVDLSGCTGVTSLSMYNNTAMTTLNVSNCSALTTLNCYNDKLSSLSLTGCSALTSLDCHSNQLTSLGTLPTSLRTLNCSANKFSGSFTVAHNNNLTTLDISSNPSITTIYCYYNPSLTSLNVKNCSAMTRLDCYSNKLSSLDLYGCSALTSLDCNSNIITSLSNLPTSLKYLYCNNNKFSGTFNLSNRSTMLYLNISSNPSITTLNCYSNALTTLNVSGCSAMTTLDCHGNQLTSLTNIPNSVQSMNCSNNKFSGTFNLTGRSNLKTLDISSNPSINTINCYSNALTTLNVSGCSAMTTLDCHGNKFASLSVTGVSSLKTLDASDNPSLTTLNCYNNALTSLNLNGCSTLTTLDCHGNQLTSLGTLPTSLQNLNCSSNKFSGIFSLTFSNALKSLDISNNTSLTRLYCYSNALTSLNVNGCPALITLDCHNNKLTALSVQGLNYLEDLIIYENQIKETAMGTLVNSLRTIPAGQTGEFQVYAIYDEGNVITMAQVLTARNKRWLPKMHGWTTSQIGDVNRDGYINAADVTALYRNILYNDETYISTSDVNMDNAVNAADVTAVYSFLLGN